MNSYYITGNTFNIKEDLKANGCKWDNDNKRWLTLPMDKEDFKYKLLESLCNAVDADMVPRNLSGDAKKIQEILNGNILQ